ncbi:hypothetical protein Mal15_50690 [Stieleria maiorica]|uniref:Subtilase-type serine protease n=1 Tax=Stieleria maiorica TaxID=2795974 RepID=A0A5B9MI51_9BACT|nr:peptidase [Stieleria maiorica]QEG00993.1 hypothetical protein Mal15_50690 [Stieleria maiorica]
MKHNQPLFVARSLAVLLIATLSPSVGAQNRGAAPHLAYVYPAGCERGMTCEVMVGGQFLKDAAEVDVSGEGVKAEIVRWYRPMTAGEYNNLNMKFREARERLVGQAVLRGNATNPTDQEIALAAGITEEQLREMEIYRRRDRDPKRQPNDQLEEQVTLRLTVALEAEPGKRELRFLGENSISNPIWFHIDRWIEVRESEPNDIVATEVTGRFPIVINGQIMPGDVDRFRMEAKQGMKLVIQVAARDVIPYLADAVPGWFQAVAVIVDASGEEVASADSFYFRQDPVLYFEVPHDGRYTLEIRDALYRGREDFVYRITVGELPLVTSVFPLGARVESESTIQLRGWNLTKTEQTIQTMSRQEYRPQRWYSSIQGDHVVRFPLQIDHWPEVSEEATNDDRATAQQVSTRMTINGRIEQPGDRDVYRINASGRIIAEIHARRLGSPLDSMLTLTDADGNEIAFNDDHEDLSQAMLTHHADSHLEASIGSQVDYFLTVSDAQGKGGPDFGYRLQLRSPQADYQLRVTPSTIMARAGQVVPITVFALRSDGFDQDIELSLVDPPPGFRLDGGVIPGESDQVRMTLSVPRTLSGKPIQLQMQGAAPRRLRSRARIIRPAVPAENMMQAFIWYHLVPVEDWNVIVSGRPGATMPLSIAMPSDRISLPREGASLLNVMLDANRAPVDQLHVDLHDAPDGIDASIVADPVMGAAIKFDVSAEEIDPGARGNLLLSVYKEFTPEPTESDPAPRPRRTEYGFLPALPFEVIGQRGSR